jgi:hypothetical protein
MPGGGASGRPGKTREVRFMYQALQPQRGRWALALGSVLALVGPGCESMSNTDRGVLGGGALGAVAGTAIGAATGHPGAGAAIGAATGAVGGGLIGASEDRMERRQQARIAAAEAARRNPPPTLQEIVQLTQSGTSDTIIIDQIRGSGQIYNLSSQDILYLQQNGVRDVVIQALQATAWQTPRHVYTAAPVQPVVVYEAAPPPPVGIGIGFRYGR